MSVSTKIFGKLIDRKDLRELQVTLSRAGNPTPARVYLGNAMLASCLIGIVFPFLGYLLLGWLMGLEAVVWLPVSLLLGVGLGFGSYRLFLAYPSIVAGSRASRIDLMLPQAATFLYAASSGGSSVFEAFRGLSEQKEHYGEVSVEASRVVRGVRYLGHDISSAIAEVARTTPSSKFMNFLDTLVTVVKMGGDVSEYFRRKSEEYRKEAVQVQKSSLETIAFFSEMYMIVFVLLPVILITMFVVFSAVGGSYTLLAYIVAYVYIPMGSAIAIVVVDLMIKGTGAKRIIFEKSREKGFRRYVKLLDENPVYQFTISIPAGVAVALAVAALQGGFSLDVFIILLIVAIVPPAVVREWQIRTVKKYEKRVPDFLRGLSSSLKAGLQLPLAIDALRSLPLGALTKPAREMIKTLKLGGNTRQALNRFARSTKSGMVYRVTALIEKSVEAGGETSKVADIASEDLMAEQSLERDRAGVMVTYVAILYISLAVFIFIGFSLTGPFLVDISENMPGEASASGQMIGSHEFTRNIFYGACTMQALFSGLLAGKLSSRSVMGGLKHSAVMLAITLLAFTFVIK